jgi:sec-independent protein translocase protein TatA
MLGLGLPELLIIVAVVLLLFGYKKLPDATRAVGRSLRIFKGEIKGMTEDDVSTKAPAQTARGTLGSSGQAAPDQAAGTQPTADTAAPPAAAAPSPSPQSSDAPAPPPATQTAAEPAPPPAAPAAEPRPDVER